MYGEKQSNVFRILSSDSDEELFVQIYGCNIVRYLLHRCKWQIFCADK